MEVPNEAPSPGTAVLERPVTPSAPPPELVHERSEIDRSCAIPCLVWFASSLFWLIVGTLLGVFASLKLHIPGMNAEQAWLTFGRIRPLHLNLVAYGWAAMAGMGVVFWLMARLSRVPIRWPAALVFAAGFWNLGLLVGSIAVLSGYSKGIEWLEFPTGAALLLFVGFAISAVWALMTFAQRRVEHVYVSQWYMFGALFWFPWLFATVQILLLLLPVKGVPQAAINWWYGHNALGLFFTPIGLATAYYLIPKVIGRPIYSYYLSIMGFWTLAAFYNWAGIHHLIGGPVPAWLVTVSIVGSMMMIIPVVTVAVNHHMTMRGNFHLLRYSPTLRFVVFGSMSYTLVSIQGSLMSLRVYNEPSHFTHHTIGHAHLGVYAFFTMIMFGAIYYIVPRLTGREWASSRLIKIHFWSTAVGITLMFVFLSIGGMVQGFEMNQAGASLSSLMDQHGFFGGIYEFFGSFEAKNGAVPFLEIVRGTIPWLVLRSLTGVLILVGHVAFVILVVRNVHAWGKQRFGTPTLFHELPAPAAEEQA